MRAKTIFDFQRSNTIRRPIATCSNFAILCSSFHVHSTQTWLLTIFITTWSGIFVRRSRLVYVWSMGAPFAYNFPGVGMPYRLRIVRTFSHVIVNFLVGRERRGSFSWSTNRAILKQQAA
jgi:hypothetical protein